MTEINLRLGINAISDVIINRPKPLREFDQIYMKAADMLLQTEHVGRIFDKKKVLFVGDGDAIGLCLMHLLNKKIISKGPTKIHILDFDERIVLAIKNFAKKYGIENKINAELYNVVDAIPKKHWQKFDGFYTNPPFGASNNGRSIDAFITRGIEVLKPKGMGYVVIADHHTLNWTKDLMYKTQKILISKNFLISEIIPEFHTYHLDDRPDLTSCNMIFKYLECKSFSYDSKPLNKSFIENFYGDKNPLRVKYVHDLTNGGKLVSKDHCLIKL